MKKVLILLSAGLISTVLLFSSCRKNEDLSVQAVFIQLNDVGERLIDSSSVFAIELFKQIEASEKEDVNWMISPFCISFALTMIYNGADGETKAVMENILGFKGLSREEININFRQISDALQDVDPNIEISNANSIWYQNTLSVLSDFEVFNHDFFDAEINPVDFNNLSAKNIINNWVAEHTDQKIRSIIKNIEPETVMFLVNAIYFRGKWEYMFNNEQNRNIEFYYEDGTSGIVEMLSQTAALRSYVNPNIIMIELPYGNGNWVMDLILPARNCPIEEFINNLSSSKWNQWVDQMSEPIETSIVFPPFKFEYEERLDTILKKMGMSIAFAPDSANFSKINVNKDIYISQVKHKTFIEVNNEGIELPYVTTDGMGFNNDIGNFYVYNRPFLFVVRERTTKAILFMGKVGNPSE